MPAPSLRLLARAAAACAVAAGLGAALPARGAGTTVTIACGSVGVELELCRSGAEAWARRTGNQVRVVTTPKDADETLAQYQQLLSFHSGEIDVLRIDVVWPGLLARHLVDLRGAVPAAVVAAHFPAIVQADTVGGRLVALPWFTDAGVLYYRKDLLERYGLRVPETWRELTDSARLVQAREHAAGRARLAGFVFEGRAYEGLTCNALEWIASAGGGDIVDAEGRVTVDNPRAVEALALAASWVRDRVAPQGVLAYAEEEARGAFQSGSAVFMRNWPYAWALSQAADSPVRGKVGVAPLPRGAEGGRPAATLGGWQLAVNRYSRNREAAIALVLWLTGPEEQKRAALTASLNPTRPALYDDPDLLRANPFLAELRGVLAHAVARPSRVTGARYPRVSSAFLNAVHDVLAGRTTPEEGLAGLQRTLESLSRGGRW